MLEKHRVLVIEDEYLTAMDLTHILQDLGHEVCAVATTEDEAVAKAQAERPDLITADVGLQSGDGISAVERITARSPLPVVYVTASHSELLRRAPSSVRVDKPFDAGELSRAIDTACGRSGATRVRAREGQA